MSVEFVPAATVRDVMRRVEEARQRAIERLPPPPAGEDDPQYWEQVFEVNAGEVLGALQRVQLGAEQMVRYRFYDRRGGDLLVRPFVAGATTDVDPIRQLIDWHAPPDSIAASLRDRPARDVDFLYRHFRFERSAPGYFEYWVAMQEMWASARWIHSHIIADGEEFAATAEREGWVIRQPVERFEPAVVREEAGAELAVLAYCPLEHQTVGLHRIRIGADQDIRFLETIPVAQGPKGYII